MSDVVITRKRTCTSKPKVSELRESFDFIRASFAIENIHFTNEELTNIEQSIRKRHRGTGFLAAAREMIQKSDR